MANRGAQNLILLSRSGPKTEAGVALLTDLKKQGVCAATPYVDISDLACLQRALPELAKSMPPV